MSGSVTKVQLLERLRAKRKYAAGDDPHAPFHAAIRDNPDNPAPKLVYADWLDERGHAEAASGIRRAVHHGHWPLEYLNTGFKAPPHYLFLNPQERWSTERSPNAIVPGELYNSLPRGNEHPTRHDLRSYPSIPEAMAAYGHAHRNLPDTAVHPHFYYAPGVVAHLRGKLQGDDGHAGFAHDLLTTAGQGGTADAYAHWLDEQGLPHEYNWRNLGRKMQLDAEVATAIRPQAQFAAMSDRGRVVSDAWRTGEAAGTLGHWLDFPPTGRGRSYHHRAHDLLRSLRALAGGWRTPADIRESLYRLQHNLTPAAHHTPAFKERGPVAAKYARVRRYALSPVQNLIQMLKGGTVKSHATGEEISVKDIIHRARAGDAEAKQELLTIMRHGGLGRMTQKELEGHVNRLGPNLEPYSQTQFITALQKENPQLVKDVLSGKADPGYLQGQLGARGVAAPREKAEFLRELHNVAPKVFAPVHHEVPQSYGPGQPFYNPVKGGANYDRPTGVTPTPKTLALGKTDTDLIPGSPPEGLQKTNFDLPAPQPETRAGRLRAGVQAVQARLTEKKNPKTQMAVPDPFGDIAPPQGHVDAEGRNVGEPGAGLVPENQADVAWNSRPKEQAVPGQGPVEAFFQHDWPRRPGGRPGGQLREQEDLTAEHPALDAVRQATGQPTAGLGPGGQPAQAQAPGANPVRVPMSFKIRGLKTGKTYRIHAPSPEIATKLATMLKGGRVLARPTGGGDYALRRPPAPEGSVYNVQGQPPPQPVPSAAPNLGTPAYKVGVGHPPHPPGQGGAYTHGQTANPFPSGMRLGESRYPVVPQATPSELDAHHAPLVHPATFAEKHQDWDRRLTEFHNQLRENGHMLVHDPRTGQRYISGPGGFRQNLGEVDRRTGRVIPESVPEYFREPTQAQHLLEEHDIHAGSRPPRPVQQHHHYYPTMPPGGGHGPVKLQRAVARYRRRRYADGQGHLGYPDLHPYFRPGGVAGMLGDHLLRRHNAGAGEDRAFLGQILTNSGDHEHFHPGPLQVYADWLDERGDPLGQHMRRAGVGIPLDAAVQAHLGNGYNRYRDHDWTPMQLPPKTRLLLAKRAVRKQVPWLEDYMTQMEGKRRIINLDDVKKSATRVFHNATFLTHIQNRTEWGLPAPSHEAKQTIDRVFGLDPAAAKKMHWNSPEMQEQLQHLRYRRRYADDKSFRRQIVAQSGTPNPTLVYADHLDERGDPLGMVLRQHGMRGEPPARDWVAGAYQWDRKMAVAHLLHHGYTVGFYPGVVHDTAEPGENYAQLAVTLPHPDADKAKPRAAGDLQHLTYSASFPVAVAHSILQQLAPKSWMARSELDALVRHFGLSRKAAYSRSARGVRRYSDHATFVKSIHAQVPDEDGHLDEHPDLVYADWLNERGDPLGQLIQAHHEQKLDKRDDFTDRRLGGVALLSDRKEPSLRIRALPTVDQSQRTDGNVYISADLYHPTGRYMKTWRALFPAETAVDMVRGLGLHDDTVQDSEENLPVNRMIRNLTHWQAFKPRRESRRKYALSPDRGEMVQALRALRSRNQETTRLLARRVLSKLGLRPHTTRDVVHEGAAGSTPDVAQMVQGGDPAKLLAAAAWYGLLANRTGVLAFNSHPEGKDRLYLLSTQTPDDRIRQVLDASGLKSRAWQPHENDYRLWVYDQGGTRRGVIAGLQDAGAVQASEGVGTGQVLGGADPAQARAAYRAVTRRSEGLPAHPHSGGYQSPTGGMAVRGQFYPGGQRVPAEATSGGVAAARGGVYQTDNR